MESDEKKTDIGRGTASNGKIKKISLDNPAGTKPKPLDNIQRNLFGGSHDESQVPRRLSQLFFPPNEAVFSKEEDSESSGLLVSDKEEAERRSSLPPTATFLPKKVSTPSKTGGQVKKDDSGQVTVPILHNIEDGKGESDFDIEDASGNSSSRSHSNSSDDSDDESSGEREGDYTSWDDTICSNRSAYFKHYYQKNLAAIGTRNSEGATSHNSLVSLIKEKDKMAEKMSAEEKKKKRKEDIGLMFLVIFLFLVLVIGISLIYHFYQLHLEEMSLFKRLKFHEDEKLLTLIDSNGHLDIQARLGTTLPMYSKPEDCTHYLQHYYKYKSTEENISKAAVMRGNKSAVDFIIKRGRTQNVFQFDEETVCLDWANQARVQIHRAPSQEHVNCYNVFWSTHTTGMSLQDCMLIRSPERGVWWGIGELQGGGFPLESMEVPSTPYKSGELSKHPWGRILRRTLLSSFGGLLILPDHLPASISINADEICVAVNTTGGLVDPAVPLTLNYTICSSPNVSSTIGYLHHLARGSMYLPPLIKKTKDLLKSRIMERIEYPVWVPYQEPNQGKLTQETVIKYIDSIMKTNQSEWGHILLPLSWQNKTGDLIFDPIRFPDPKGMVDEITRKGFRLALTISPLVSTDTKAFSNGTTEGFWVQQLGSSLPALVQHDSVVAGAYTDFTNPRAAKWFVAKLAEIEKQYGIDRFHLDPPDAYSLPQFHEFNQNILNADLALQPFLKGVTAVSAPLSTESILSPPPLPTFVTISREESSWKSLASLVPKILTLSILGFPLVDAGIVGGTPVRAGNVVDDQLFIRWFQAITFLPAYQMNVLPDIYDDDTQSIIAACQTMRKELVLPRLEKAVEGTLVNNTPLIFPLGLLYPDDLDAAAVGDEWILGEDLLVAPILEKGKKSRDIYIPSGLWESQLDGRLKRGPGWIHEYKVPISDIALFIKRYTM